MALSTNQYGYIIDPMVPFTDDKGKTIKNGFVRIFEAGSSTPVVTYRNFDGATNTDKIELDNSGRTMTSVICSKGLTYKVCVYDSHHSQENPILTVDKVSVIGANITAGTGATVVTGLDGLRTKPDGFVDASIIGTDGYVAIDHTIVTDDLDTDAKVTAVEDDRYIPLLNEDVNDPDSKMTLGRLWQWVLGKIKSLSTTITSFRTGDVIPVDGPSGTAKMAKDDLLKETSKHSVNVMSTTYALGTFVSHNGLEYPSTTSIRTDFIESSENLVVCPPEGYFVQGVCYYTDKTKTIASFVSSTFFDYDDDCTCAKVGGTGNYYRIVFKKISGNASASDGDNTSYFYSNEFCEQTIDYLKIKDKCRRTATMQIFDDKAHNLDDLNNASVNTTYIIQRTANTLTSNFPSDFSTDAYPSILDTYKVFYDTNQYQVFQYLFKPNELKLWFRIYNSYTLTWSAWTLSTEQNFTTSLNQIFDSQAFNLASLNDADVNTIKVIQRTANTATTDFPSSYPKSGFLGMLVTTKTNYNPSKYQVHQVLVNFNSNAVWTRVYTDYQGTWSAWTLSTGTVHVGADQQYTRLRDAFTDAYAGTNVKVIVHPGTYDLVQEFSDVLPTINALTGCPIGHDMHVIFMSGTKVTANIDPNDFTLEQREKIVVFFEPICAKGGSYTIENLVIEATDTRYCVHDELGFSYVPYVHKYINCKMKKVTTNNVTNALYPPAIGGGLGKYGVIEIDGGVYEADISRGIPSVQSGDVAYAQQCITYHNCGDHDNAVSAISLKDVYFKNRGYFRVGDYGATLLLSKVTACGCHFGLPMLHKWEMADVHDNFEIEAEWNNEQSVAGEWSVSGNTTTFVPA